MRERGTRSRKWDRELNRLKQLYQKVKTMPKRRLILLSVSIKLIEVAISTYLIKKFFLK
jgi:hypothetical protein